MSKNDENCIKNEEFCIKNEAFCIENEAFCNKNDEFCRKAGRVVVFSGGSENLHCKVFFAFKMMNNL